MQVPEESNVAALPDTVQTVPLMDEKLTTRPDDAEADKAREVETSWSGIGAKVMVCELADPFPFRVILCVAGVPLRELSVNSAEPCI